MWLRATRSEPCTMPDLQLDTHTQALQSSTETPNCKRIGLQKPRNVHEIHTRRMRGLRYQWLFYETPTESYLRPIASCVDTARTMLPVSPVTASSASSSKQKPDQGHQNQTCGRTRTGLSVTSNIMRRRPGTRHVHVRYSSPF